MIKGTGIDIVEIARIGKLLAKGELFTEKVFSKRESAYCEKQGVPVQSYAGKFAAKEAFLKAIGTGWRGEIELHQIEITNDELGKPQLQITGDSKNTLAHFANMIVHVSVSHTNIYAVAQVIIESLESQESV